jgi:hypothetical protein
MTPQRLRQVLDSLDLTQVGAAKFLGASPRNVRRWVAGDAPIPLAVEMLLELMIARKLSPNGVRRQLGLLPLDGHNNPVGNPQFGNRYRH